MTAKTKAQIIEEEVVAIADELTKAGFTPSQINALYHAMIRAATIHELESMDDRIFSGDDSGY